MNIKDLQFGDIIIINNEKYVFSDNYLYGESTNYDFDCRETDESVLSEIDKVLRNGKEIFQSDKSRLEKAINLLEKIYDILPGTYNQLRIELHELLEENKKEPIN